MPFPSLLISCQSLHGSQLCHVFPSSLLFFQWVVEFSRKEPFKNLPQLWGKTKHWTVSSMLFIDSQKFIMAMVHLASPLPLPWNSVGSLQANYFDKQNCSSFKAHKNFDLRDSREYWHKWYFLIGQLELLMSICLRLTFSDGLFGLGAVLWHVPKSLHFTLTSVLLVFSGGFRREMSCSHRWNRCCCWSGGAQSSR